MKWNNKGYQFDKLGKQFKKKNRIYIYGAGDAAIAFIMQLRNLNLEELIDGFIDKDINKQRDGYLGKEVYSPDILFEKHEEDHIIVPAFYNEEYKKIVTDRLERAGYVENLDWFKPEKFILSLNDIFLPIYSWYANNKFIISSICIVPSTKCNLNCRDCLNFTPHLPSFEDRNIDDICKDVDLLFRTIDYTGRFQISGGEPVLYNNLRQLITYIGENYRSKIGIYETILNGTIVPSDEICETIEIYDMTVYLDNYVNAIHEKMNKRDEIIKKLEEYNIKWIDNNVDTWFSLNVFETDNSNMDEASLIEYFDTCNNPWHCYENGKMYVCNFARFAMKANLNIETENDYFDLNTVNESNKIDFLEFTLNYNSKGYVDFCKRCAGWCSVNTNIVPVAIQSERKNNFE